MAPLPPFSGSSELSLVSLENDAKGPAQTVVIVTPYSTGCWVAYEVQKLGYKLICLWSAGFSEVMKTHCPSAVKNDLHYDVEIDEQDTMEATAALIHKLEQENNWQVVSCVCGGEAGVDLADGLSEYLGLKTNGTCVANRRDKKVQQDLIKAAGLRGIREVAGNKLSDVQEFLEDETYPIIVKPLDSAGSDGVKLCHTYQEARDHFLYLINDHEMVNGGSCHDVLCQEFLRGREYVVDHVSCDGVHKTVMVWVYDKRNANGAPFVYFGDIPVDTESQEAKLLIPYARAVLDALGVKYGPSHGEIIMTPDGPCLVEMNCRAHGGDGNWRPLVLALNGGYDQVSATVDAYLHPERFDALPDKPPSPFLASGQCVDLVNYTDGVVQTTPGYDVIRALPSFVAMEAHIKPGSKIKKTVDLATDAGTVVLMHPNEDVLSLDIAVIRKLEASNLLFTFEQDTNEDLEWQERRRMLIAKPCSLDFRALDANAIMARTKVKQHRRILSGAM